MSLDNDPIYQLRQSIECAVSFGDVPLLESLLADMDVLARNNVRKYNYQRGQSLEKIYSAITTIEECNAQLNYNKADKEFIRNLEIVSQIPQFREDLIHSTKRNAGEEK